jgi:hypothetical protein
MAGNGSSRRSFVKLLAAAPLLTQIATRDLYAQATTAMGVGAKQNVYSRRREDRHQLPRTDLPQRLAGFLSPPPS